MFKPKYASLDALTDAVNVKLSEVQAIGYREFVRLFSSKHEPIVLALVEQAALDGRITISGDGRKGSPKTIRKTLAQPPSANVEPRSEV